MACSPTCTLNGRLLIEILSRCGECWENGTRAIRAASLAAASQSLRTFCNFLKDEVDDVTKTLPEGPTRLAQAAAVYNEVIPVIQWLCSRLVEPKTLENLLLEFLRFFKLMRKFFISVLLHQ